MEVQFSVASAEKDTVSTSTYLLSNALPLLAFDFTKYESVIQFMIVFGCLAVLCLLYYRCDSNICLEVAGYRIYKCCLNGERGVQKDIVLLIRRTQLNTNDKVSVRKLNDELYIGKYIETE